jgi:hypothetical protein
MMFLALVDRIFDGGRSGSDGFQVVARTALPDAFSGLFLNEGVRKK